DYHCYSTDSSDNHGFF
nr:immunoglobulin light chain junction region [Macaca mulatta]MOW17161.1 immunoglobulin light chain junction region [Macaca mulatta]MOX33676.1 immunoglobulin light chain junction region [Macaca mulatta]MOX35469.1 immunoglobulin light chain junction region [Macaca mulatta]MOX35803.1 immunoglobulin light chain junction region [Macaca mulatta]